MVIVDFIIQSRTAAVRIGMTVSGLGPVFVTLRGLVEIPPIPDGIVNEMTFDVTKIVTWTEIVNSKTLDDGGTMVNARRGWLPGEVKEIQTSFAIGNDHGKETLRGTLLVVVTGWLSKNVTVVLSVPQDVSEKVVWWQMTGKIGKENETKRRNQHGWTPIFLTSQAEVSWVVKVQKGSLTAYRHGRKD